MSVLGNVYLTKDLDEDCINLFLKDSEVIAAGVKIIDREFDIMIAELLVPEYNEDFKLVFIPREYTDILDKNKTIYNHTFFKLYSSLRE